MGTVQTTIRLDADTKQQFEAVVNQLGMSASTAYNLFARATIRKQGLPFDVVLDPYADPSVRAKVKKELEEISAYADSPEAEYVSHDRVKEMLGL